MSLHEKVSVCVRERVRERERRERRERERDCVCVCVCVCIRSMLVMYSQMSFHEKVSLRLCVCVRERERDCVCVRARVYIRSSAPHVLPDEPPQKGIYMWYISLCACVSVHVRAVAFASVCQKKKKHRDPVEFWAASFVSYANLLHLSALGTR